MPPLLATNIAAEIARICALSVEDLSVEWSRLIGGSPPKTAHRDYITRAVVHRLQVDRYGGLPTATMRGLKKLRDDHAVDPKQTQIAARVLAPGTRILREWQGEMHEAIVVENGFLFRGQTYKSLSVIARRITGTRWSGPLFFGLKGPRRDDAQRSDIDSRKSPSSGTGISRLSTSTANAAMAEISDGR